MDIFIGIFDQIIEEIFFREQFAAMKIEPDLAKIPVIIIDDLFKIISHPVERESNIDNLSPVLGISL